MSLMIILACFLAGCLYGGALSQNVYHVVPDNSIDCPSNDASRCHTFAYYVESFDKFFISNTTFNFLPGNHTLSRILRVTDLEFLTFSGIQREASVIQCEDNMTAGLMIMNVSSLKIADVTFVECHIETEQEHLMMNTYAKTFLEFTFPVAFGIYLNYIFDVEITRTGIHRSVGYGLLGVNLFGEVVFDDVNFTENNYKTLDELSCSMNKSLGCKGGNLALVYTDLLNCPGDPPRYSVTISNSSFTKGVDSGISYVPFNAAINRNDLQFIGGAGIGLHMMQSSYGIDALIENCFIESNAAFVGANMYSLMWDFVDNSTIIVRNSTLSHGVNAIGPNDPVILTGSYDLAMGFFYYYGLRPFGLYNPVCQAERKYEVGVFTMEDCDVSYNNATLASAGLAQASPQSFLDCTRELLFKRTRFHFNNGDATVVLFGNGLASNTFKTFFIDCLFTSNLYERLNSSFVASTSYQVMYHISAPNVEYINCSWINNRVTALHAIQSRVILTGENKFINNSAINGGGLQIESGSEVFLQPSSRTLFIGNRAEKFGGAIYAVMLSYRCFFQLDPNQDLPFLYFSNNYAGRAGEAVYGNLRVCVLDGFTYADNSFDIFFKISEFSEELRPSSSIVSSNANRLCLCAKDAPSCSLSSASFYNISTYPGKKFDVLVQAFGFFGDQNVSGHTPADVGATIIDSTSYAIIASGNDQNISKECSSVTYMLEGNANQDVDVSLFPITDVLFYPAYIKVKLQNCPIGFSLESFTCKCASFFDDRRITCTIDEVGTFFKDEMQWIGYVDDQLAVGTCIESEYCNKSTELYNFTFNDGYDFDPQCVDHHSGILCGGCEKGYSFSLGSSQCMKCSNKYLALLIFFAAAGIMWIAFLSFFDATVKTGRINGMLFYANVIKLANFEFFRMRQPEFAVFQVIINWINLDFGIVSCFYDGFDYYAKCWFNFAFPLYLFVHIGIIVFCARKFDKFCKLLPKNILPVITTLVLMCFTKLLRSSTNVLPYQTLEMENKTRRLWQFDANVVYFDLKHSILFVFSLLVLLVFVIPFAVIMISYPYLQSFTTHENTFFESFVCFFRRKIFKFKPVLETYDGPFLIKHRYFTGLLILARMLIYLITVSVYASNGQDWFKPTSISIICIALLGLVASVKIYVCSVNTGVELLYLANVTGLEFALLVMQLSSVEQMAQGIVVSISIALAFATFIGVLVYEKYLILEPKIYEFFKKEYVPRSEGCNAARRQEEMKRTMTGGINDEMNKILDVIDEDRETRNRMQSKQEELIQQLIISENPASL